MLMTETGNFPDDPSAPGYGARTDIKLDALDASPWFLFPYPGTLIPITLLQISMANDNK